MELRLGIIVVVFLVLLVQDAELDEFSRAYEVWQKLMRVGKTCAKLQPLRTMCEDIAPMCRKTNCRTDCPPGPNNCPDPNTPNDCPCKSLGCPDPICPAQCNKCQEFDCTDPICPEQCEKCQEFDCTDPICPEQCEKCQEFDCTDPICPEQCEKCQEFDCTDPICPEKCPPKTITCDTDCPPPSSGNYEFCKNAVATTPSGKVTYEPPGTPEAGASDSKCTFTIGASAGKTVTVICTPDGSKVILNPH